MKTADEALKQIEETTRASLALTHPKTRVTAETRIRTSDETSSPVIDMA
ncbi:MAG TPA: hypothetical protein VEV43_11905 [Actinomycetota bacterium]|nr:hypothetical protein [Actinomycetota bacterium]